MGFFKKIFSALKKTKDAFGKKISALFTGDKIGEEFYEDLTDVLISSDVSFSTADEIVENLRDRMIEERTADKDYVINTLKEVLTEKLDEAGVLEIEYPAVITLIGVN
jgi:fused signal recognition particle receptor